MIHAVAEIKSSCMMLREKQILSRRIHGSSFIDARFVEESKPRCKDQVCLHLPSSFQRSAPYRTMMCWRALRQSGSTKRGYRRRWNAGDNSESMRVFWRAYCTFGTNSGRRARLEGARIHALRSSLQRKLGRPAWWLLRFARHSRDPKIAVVTTRSRRNPRPHVIVQCSSVLWSLDGAR